MPHFDKLHILIWKQWLIEKRNPFKWGSEIALPLLVATALLFINTFYTTKLQQDAIFKQYETGIGKTNFSNTTEIVYCPTNGALDMLIKKTAAMIGISRVKKFEDEQEMNNYVNDQVVHERLFSAIEFHDVKQQGLPARLKVSLRFPEFLVAQGYNTSWLTDVLFPPVFDVSSERIDPDDDQGPPPHYQRKGFLLLQEALSRVFIGMISPTRDLPRVLMQRYPRTSWRSREIYDSPETLFNIVLFMFLSYIFLFIGVIKLVTQEKESQVKQALETAGVPYWILWMCYFIRSLILFLFCFILLLFALNTPTSQSLVLYSNNLLLFLFFVCFASASIALAFLISIVHSSTVAAATVGAMLWFISFLTFYQVQQDIFGRLMAYLFAPLAFFHGFNIIIAFELNKEGLQWSNLWKYPTPDHNFCFAHILLSLTVCAIFYLLLTLCIEGEKFAVVSLYWRKLKKRKRERESIFIFDDVVQERPPSNLPLTVKILNLRKVYSKGFKAVENVSLELYEDQITVLLGPNGAGKTTTACIIVGIMKPTQGVIRIYKSNVWKLLGEDQTYIGYCPQTNILFDELTVEEHIYLFSRIKGFDSITSIEEADKYMNILQLNDKAATPTRHLTEGLKRRLSIALALCARSKLVVLDEPTAGVDPISRRSIWNMLHAEKRGRSILITTHSTEEAEILGDRIAIICEGVLKCCGSSAFLKNEFADGYRLVIIKSVDCRTVKVLNFIKKHIANVTVASDIGAQLCFKLEKQYFSVVEQLLKDLEENQDKLAIQSFRISMPNLEDVFMRNTIGYYTVPVDQVEEKPVQFLKGYHLVFNRILALLVKKFLVFKASWALLLMHIVFVLLLVLVNEFAVYNKQTYDMPLLKISLESYDDPILLVQGDDFDLYKRTYKREVDNTKGRTIDTRDIVATIFRHMKKDRVNVLNNYAAGATFLMANDSITAWYNSFPFHSAPLSLNLVMNTILHTYSSKHYSIEIFNHPLRLTKLQKTLRANTSIYGALQYLIAVFSCMFIIFVIRDAYGKSMYQQFVCGIDTTMYWLMTFLCDITLYTIVVVLVLIVLTLLTDIVSDHFFSFGQLFQMLFNYGFASLHFYYLIHRIFTKPSTGYITVILISTLGIMLATVLQHAAKIVLLSKWVNYMFLFMPTFSLANGLAGLNRLRHIERVCTMLFDSCMKYAQKENCTKLVEQILTEDKACGRPYFSMDKLGFLLYLVALVIFGFIYAFLNILIDSPLIPRHLNRYYKRKFRQVLNEEEDVIREREWVRKASIKELGERAIVLKDVCKTYNRQIALNRVSLALSPYDCLGLIGPHGAGKTTIFKLLTGGTFAYSGDVLVAGLNMNLHLRKIRQMTVYCPEQDGLFINLTCEQNIIIYALIQGVPYKKTKDVAEVLAQKLDFRRYLHKTVRHFSRGNQRKLSAAIAFIGNAKVILLDEPGTGMDVSTSKHLWAAINTEREKGTAILLSTHSMEECEAVCNRIGVLVKGKMMCLGSTQRLTSKFGKGYYLTIRGKREKQENVVEEERNKKLIEFIKQNIPTAELLESFKEVHTFQIQKTASLSWAKLFKIIDNNKKFLDIEDYTLSQSSLEQAFLSVS